MIWNILICALAATGLIFLGWCIAAWVLLPVSGSGLYMVACPKNDAAQLEQQCRAYRFLYSAGIIRLPLLVIDDGLNEEGRKLAEILARTYPNVMYCDSAEKEEH